MTPASLSRPLGLFGAAAGGIAALFVIPGLTHPPGADPGSVSGWWEGIGTPAATLAILRAAMLGALVYIAGVALWWIIAALATAAGRRGRLPRFVPRGLRRYLAGGTLSLAVMVPSLASAREQAPFSLVDLGPVDEPELAIAGAAAPFIAVDLGPVLLSTEERIPLSTTEEETIARAPHEAAGNTWQVQRGDHLWSIAFETITERVGNPSDREIERYWRRVIADNRDVVGSDPDLIVPGQRIVLPPL